ESPDRGGRPRRPPRKARRRVIAGGYGEEEQRRAAGCIGRPATGGDSFTDSEAPLVLDVERLTFGFDALAHHGRQVVFVPYAAPADRVQAEVVERRGGYLRARIAAVLVPGPARVLPGCRYFPTCGGCQWQQVAPPAQRDAKAAIVAEQLARVAGVRDAEVLPTVPSPADWHYRARITLAVEGRRAGYRRARSHDLVEIADCPPGDPTVRVALEPGLALEVPADVFTQVNPGANRRLVETVVALGAFAPGARVLDLYCGAGNLSLPLARRGVTVLGIERSRVAVEAA